MLIQFNFKNYKSFKEDVSLDMSELQSHVVEIANGGTMSRKSTN